MIPAVRIWYGEPGRVVCPDSVSRAEAGRMGAKRETSSAFCGLYPGQTRRVGGSGQAVEKNRVLASPGPAADQERSLRFVATLTYHVLCPASASSPECFRPAPAKEKATQYIGLASVGCIIVTTSRGHSNSGRGDRAGTEGSRGNDIYSFR